MKFKLAEKKLDYKLRNRIIKQYQDKTLMGGDPDIIHFTELPLSVAKKLERMGFVDPEEYQGEGPTNKVIMEWVAEHPGFWLHGYLITEKRDDTRINFEGVGCNDYDDQELKDFTKMFRHADDFVIEPDRLWAWYD